MLVGLSRIVNETIRVKPPTRVELPPEAELTLDYNPLFSCYTISVGQHILFEGGGKEGKRILRCCEK